MPTSQPTRRDFARSALTLGGLSLPGVLRLRAATQAPPATAVIFIQLGGGASHMETYDPKPDAPAEYRGAFRAIRTSVPGVSFCELLPRQARLMHRLVVARSVQHHEASHIALHAVETGYFLKSNSNILKGEMPSVGSVVSRLRGEPSAGLPAYVSMPRAFAYSGPHYLGGRHAAFNVNGDPSAADFSVSNLALAKGLVPDCIGDRQALVRSFDNARRLIDLDGQAPAMDDFQRQALDLVTGDRARTAFDLGREPTRLRDHYGKSAFGQRLLLARRLVEAGVPFVLVRTFDWDDHLKLPERMRGRAPEFDGGVAALIEDLRDRGLDKDVLVVAMGEFGRTPRVNPNAGRDHWPAVMSVLLAGGRWRAGQVVGASDSKGAFVAQAPYRPQQVLGMVYRHLGIDPGRTFPDFTGRPRHILEQREPIAELT
jgi:uncharacterized protein (DUF1501 family)